LNQKELSIQDIELSQKTFEVNESLKKDRVISELDYRVEKSKLIGKKLTLPQINTSLLNNEALQNEKQKEIAELENTISQQKYIFIQSINTMRSEIENWKRRYVLTAPIDGEVSFARFLQENQQLREGESLCFINPFNTIYYAELYIPQKNFGKVFIGQKVLLKFPSYPFQEYGIVIGQVDLISNIPTDSGYLAKVSLPYALETNFKKRVQFREGLQAEGEIVTKDIRLLQRFYYSISGQVERY
jgi:HlyD family secretion protein